MVQNYDDTTLSNRNALDIVGYELCSSIQSSSLLSKGPLDDRHLGKREATAATLAIECGSTDFMREIDFFCRTAFGRFTNKLKVSKSHLDESLLNNFVMELTGLTATTGQSFKHMGTVFTQG